jgi:hypothetical protein
METAVYSSASLCWPATFCAVEKICVPKKYKPIGYWKISAVFPEGWHSNYDVSLDELQTWVDLKGLHYFWMANIQPSTVVAARSKAWVYGLTLAEIAGSNSAAGMDACLLWMLCVVQVEAFATGWSLVQSSHLVWVSLRMIRYNSHPLHLRWGGTRSRTKKKRNHLQLLPRPTDDETNDSLADSILYSQLFFSSWSTSVAFRRSVETNSNKS